MERRPASIETIGTVIGNSKALIADSEQTLHNIELIKSKIGEDDFSRNYLLLIFELLGGSLAGIHEVCSDLKNMLLTKELYAKRYHMQMINLAQIEWCGLLAGRSQDGIIYRLMNYLRGKHYTSDKLVSILEQVKIHGKKCDRKLRNVTAHYDMPTRMYDQLMRLDDEDIYVKRISNQMAIHQMILNYVSPILQIMVKDTSNLSHGSDCIVSGGNNTLLQRINEKFYKASSDNKKLSETVAKQLSNAWNSIEFRNKMFESSSKAIEFLESEQLNSNRLRQMRSAIEMLWIVDFMKYDLACSTNSYLNASTNIEQSICLMRVYRIEIAALTHLYGYDEVRKQQSIWTKIKAIPEYNETSLSVTVEEGLKALTSDMDSHRRNLYTHYREGLKLNSSERWQHFTEMNHPKEMLRMIELITICANITKFLTSLLSLMDSTHKKEINEILEPIRKIKELGQKNNLPDIVKMSDKLLSLL